MKVRVASERKKRESAAVKKLAETPEHKCWENATPYTSRGALAHGWECGICRRFLQAG